MSTMTPTAVAYMDVTVPVSAAPSRERAEEIVARYMYGNSQVVGTEFDFGHDAHTVTVRREFFDAEPNPAWHMQAQQDRFASGLYRTSAPVIFVAKGN